MTQLLARGMEDRVLMAGNNNDFFIDILKNKKQFSSKYVNLTSYKCQFGGNISIPIERRGDLVKRIYIQLSLGTNGSRWVPDLGSKFIKNLSVTIGGQVIYKLDSDFCHIYNGLRSSKSKKVLYKNMINLDNNTLLIPITFGFFSKSLFLPIVSLKWHEVSIKLEFEDLSRLYVGDCSKVNKDIDCSLKVEYIFLSDETRKILSSESLGYLIEQSQCNTFDLKLKSAVFLQKEEYIKNIIRGKFKISVEPIVDLIYLYASPKLGRNEDIYKKSVRFYFPVKEFFIILKPKTKYAQFDYLNYITNIEILLNGETLVNQDKLFFTKLQHYEYHTSSMRNVYTYSFSLNPEDCKLDGTCNFTQVNKAEFRFTYDIDKITIDECDLKIYAINYNMLKISSGLGGLFYSV